MSFFDKIFKKRNNKSNEVLSLDLIDLEKLINDKLIKDSKWVIEFKESFKKILNELENNSKDLKKVSFERGVDVRVENRINDNIDNYINKINILIDRLNKIDFDFFKLNYLINEYDKEISKFNKETIKNYYLIHVVFKNEIIKVAKSLKDLDFIINDIKNNVNKQEYKDYINLIKNINSITQCKHRLDNINKSLLEKKKDYNSVVEEINNANKLLEKLNKSEEYLDYKNLEHKREDYIKEIGVLKGDILNKFQILEKGLKKLNRIFSSKKLSDYCETPLSFFEDESFEIFTFIYKLKESISSGVIDLEDKNKRVLDFIDSVKKEDLIRIKDNYSKCLENIKMIDQSLSESIILKKVLDYNYKINSLKIKSDNLEIEISNLNISGLEEEYLDTKRVLEEEYYRKFSDKILIKEYSYYLTGAEPALTEGN